MIRKIPESTSAGFYVLFNSLNSWKKRVQTTEKKITKNNRTISLSFFYCLLFLLKNKKKILCQYWIKS